MSTPLYSAPWYTVSSRAFISYSALSWDGACALEKSALVLRGFRSAAQTAVRTHVRQRSKLEGPSSESLQSSLCIRVRMSATHAPSTPQRAGGDGQLLRRRCLSPIRQTTRERHTRIRAAHIHAHRHSRRSRSCEVPPWRRMQIASSNGGEREGVPRGA
ncbi:hypothetical protein L226DRAFT_93009 [Lentinus tigrinus ALCF2SS1-7]|uniref:Uncharacterized protein n=1 Tax=Lentinus tigrinus ALCF2SS1-6 TaxID=1328759 RepID=A0A5C2RYI4_9APHY|nr:hypothetical protein L227DRAFT_286783 [Lentinus tigrinus ALCF2SS1-6]RPD74019.1 hypothetical protein L226DRAFT_93009 [Lentinus tigrinus ALCF2SS1-7]